LVFLVFTITTVYSFFFDKGKTRFVQSAFLCCFCYHVGLSFKASSLRI
jgi:hypothetical protein